MTPESQRASPTLGLKIEPVTLKKTEAKTNNEMPKAKLI
jgi:hypothetical protein